MNKNAPPNAMKRAVQVSLAGNVVLFSAKAAALFAVNSLAVAADLGVSSVSLGISILLYYAVRLSERPADGLHNYGYGKIENVCEAVEGMILIGIALAMTFQSVMNLLHPREIANPGIGLAVGLLGIAINFAGARYILKLARESRSPAIRAEGVHYRLEGYISSAVAATFVVLLGFRHAGWHAGEAYVDPVATLGVSALILLPSLGLVKQAFLKLLDASIEEESKMDVIKVLSRHFDRYCEFTDLRTRSAGRRRFVEVKLILPEHIPFREGHRVAQEMEKDILEIVPGADVLVKITPCGKDCAYADRGEEHCPYVRQETHP